VSGRPRDVVNVTSAALRQWPLPKTGEDKESRGRVLVVGGNRQTPGAVLLAAEAALRSGAGKLQVATVESLAPHLAVALPEALVLGLPETPGGDISPAAGDAILELAGGCAAILLGPGLMDPETSVELMGSIVPRLRTTLVVDALAMAYLTEHRQGVRHLAGRAVLTPNGAELAQTLGVEPDTVAGAYAEHREAGHLDGSGRLLRSAGLVGRRPGGGVVEDRDRRTRSRRLRFRRRPCRRSPRALRPGSRAGAGGRVGGIPAWTCRRAPRGGGGPPRFPGPGAAGADPPGPQRARGVAAGIEAGSSQEHL